MCRADGNPINVLVVDDETVLAEMVSMALRYEGWNIATAGVETGRADVPAGTGLPAASRIAG